MISGRAEPGLIATMIHYTLNTAHSRISPRSEVSDDAIAACLPLAQNGTHPMPGAGNYVCDVRTRDGCLLATVRDIPGRPCVAFAVAVDYDSADLAWRTIEPQYLRFGDEPIARAADFAAPKRPEATPWCAAMTMFATPCEAYWIADFERCLAWAWIEKNQRNQ